MATVSLNGSSRTLSPPATVASLLKELGLEGQGGLAVEVDEEVVPRSEHAARVLADGDRVEVVTMLAGG